MVPQVENVPECTQKIRENWKPSDNTKMLDKKWILLLIISYIVTDEASADRILTRICSGKVCISEEYSKTFHTELPPVIEVGKKEYVLI